MALIYDWFIETGIELGVWEFFQRIGAWGTFFVLLACGLLALALVSLLIYLFAKIPNNIVKWLFIAITVLIFVFGVFIVVELAIPTISALGGLVGTF